MPLALGGDARVHREHLERGSPRAIRADDAGVEAIEHVVDLPLVHVYPLDPLRVLLGEAEHEIDGLLRARLRLRQRDLALLGDELDDAAGLGQPDRALHRLQQRVGAARAEAVGVRVVVQAPETRLALGLRQEGGGVTADVRSVEEIGSHDRAATAAGADDVVVERGLLRVFAGRLRGGVDLVPRRDVLDPGVLLVEGLPRLRVLRLRRAFALLAGADLAARVLERDKRADAVAASGLQPRVEAGRLGQHRAPRRNEARVAELQDLEVLVAEGGLVVVGDADRGQLPVGLHLLEDDRFLERLPALKRVGHDYGQEQPGVLGLGERAPGGARELERHELAAGAGQRNRLRDRKGLAAARDREHAVADVGAIEGHGDAGLERTGHAEVRRGDSAGGDRTRDERRRRERAALGGAGLAQALVGAIVVGEAVAVSVGDRYVDRRSAGHLVTDGIGDTDAHGKVAGIWVGDVLSGTPS